MHFFKWLFGGIVGGAIGAAAWVGIEYATKSEYGWIAWPVGLLVGLGVHKAASADIRGGFFRGAVAALLALAAVMGAGKAKEMVMRKQAEKASQPVLIADAMAEESETAEPSDTSPASQEILAMPDVSSNRGAMAIKPANALKDLNMLWLCLSAVTAYMIGKGSGPSTLPTEEETAEAEKQAEQPTTDEQ